MNAWETIKREQEIAHPFKPRRSPIIQNSNPTTQFLKNQKLLYITAFTQTWFWRIFFSTTFSARFFLLWKQDKCCIMFPPATTAEADDEVVTRVKGYIGNSSHLILDSPRRWCMFHLQEHVCTYSFRITIHVFLPLLWHHWKKLSPSDAGTCGSISSSSSCGASATSYFKEITYNGKRVLISNQV